MLLSVLSPAALQNDDAQASRLICHTVVTCVALDFHLHPDALMARTRGAPQTAFARQMAMYLAHVASG